MTRTEIIKRLSGMLTVNQKEAIAVAKAIEIIRETEWIEPELEMPPVLESVIGLVTGRANGREVDEDPFVVCFSPDEGWILVDVQDDPEDDWKVVKWKPVSREDE